MHAAVGLAVFLLATPAFAQADLERPGTWELDVDEALAKAKETGRPVLAVFTGRDWCNFSQRLAKDVLSKPAFGEWSAAHVVLLELDFPRDQSQMDPKVRERNQRVVERLQVAMIPTLMLLDGAGDRLAEVPYTEGGLEAWQALADSKLKAIARRKELNGLPTPTPAQRLELLQLDLELGRLAYAQAATRRAQLGKLTPEQAATVEPAIFDLQVLAVEAELGPVCCQDDVVKIGKRYRELYGEGKRPTAEAIQSKFYGYMMEFAAMARDVEAFTASLEVMRPMALRTPQGKTWVAAKEQQLAEMRAAANGK